MDATRESTNVLQALSTGLADAVERAGRAVVVVNGRPRHGASGIVIAAGRVLTADHVLEREDELTIETPDGRTLAAQFAGRDPATDLALLQVPDLNLEAAEQAAPARVGQLVLAVGRPSAEGTMASIGIVSAVGGPLRTQWGVTLEQYIRTDATPYPGFSGGPLIDTAGAVIGLTTTGLINGVTLGVPAAIAWRIAETLAEHGSIKRGYLGISSQPVQLPEGQRAGWEHDTGLLIVRVEPDSPAGKGGLLLGDILIAFDGQPVTDTDDLQALLGGHRVGKSVPVDVIRAGERRQVDVAVGARE
ncbi:MAG TPA: trypsin-like peptidase domain-containing protein [Chloroflexia bacterium]|nr:trypsin-like peptidase domain-containing protein [Chloroflexia bacterium]